MSKAMTRKAWLEYLQKAVDDFDWEAAGQEQGEPDKYVMDIECTKCGAKQSGILTVNTTPQPAQKPWVGLTDDERNVIIRHHAYVSNIIDAIEAKLKEKNT